jgi:hypothetical protein
MTLPLETRYALDRVELRAERLARCVRAELAHVSAPTRIIVLRVMKVKLGEQIAAAKADVAREQRF